MSGPQRKNHRPGPSKQDILIAETQRVAKGVWALLTLSLLDKDHHSDEFWQKMEMLCKFGFLSGTDVLALVDRETIKQQGHRPYFADLVKSLD